MSKGPSDYDLLRAVRFPPARNVDNTTGALPEATFDLKVIHPLNTDLILEASLASGNSAEVGEIEKHAKNDQMCARLGWTCIPLVVEVYGGWGCEAKECYSRLSKRLAMQVGICETEALCQMYCLLAVTLMRQNARAILLRCARAPLLEYSH
eukprot:Em0024g128a